MMMTNKMRIHLLLVLVVCYGHAFSPSTTVVLTKQAVAKEEKSSKQDDVLESNLHDLPPVIQQIADERREFQVNLGKAMDTLKKDLTFLILVDL